MSHRVVCTTQEPQGWPTRHAHIVAIGTGNNPAQSDRKWTLAQVVHAIDVEGEGFYTIGAPSGRTAYVETIPCPHRCGHRIIRCKPDAVWDNNLDSLRTCNWR